jgi:hypothetical protein
MIPTLETLLERGEQAAPAVKLAADKRTVYYLTLELEGKEPPPGLQGPLRVEASPEHQHRGNVTSIKLDVVGEPFTLSVTALFNANLDARHAAPLSMPDAHYENVLRIIEARAGGGEVVVFVSGAVPRGQSEAGIITATRLIAVRLVELRLATQRTLTVVKITNHNSHHPDIDHELGTPMYGGSDVLVGTIGSIAIPSSKPTDEHRLRLHLRLLFEGGAWAVQQDDGNDSTKLPIAGPPSEKQLRADNIRVRTAHEGTHACIIVHTTDPYASKNWLLVVHDALRHAEPMLRHNERVPGLDVDKTIALMRNHVKRSSELAIFAFSSDASQRGRVQRVMRTLYDLGVTAQQPSKDACVVLCHIDEAGLRMEATRLLSLIRDKSTDLRRREIGSPVARVTPVAKKPKLGDREIPVRHAPVGPLAELPKRPPPCAVS